MVTTKPLLDNVQQVGLLIYDFSFVPLFRANIFTCHSCIFSHKLSKQLPVFTKKLLKKTSDTGINDRKVVSTNLILYLYTNIVWDNETAKVKSFQDFAPCIKEAFEVSLKKDV
ncbi:CGH_1_collapsed_G0000840.mRNA.1.CDS.1 [Saccharomyces cerevisiae]|nr:CGH_1_collapsed_G0000840.mRNA.1.CDS.1 [Saccharomyces cerevisiae]